MDINEKKKNRVVEILKCCGIQAKWSMDKNSKIKIQV